VTNVGLAKPDLKYVYFCGGAVTLFTLVPIGGLADRLGKLAVFRLCAGLTAVSVLVIGYLPPLPLPVVLLATTFFMIVSSARMVPAMALITASAEPRWRGSFLSVNSAVQQTAIGLAALLAGALLTRAPNGNLVGFERVGWLAAVATLLSMALAGRLRSGEEETAEETPAPVPETAMAA
jgi:predicted MFS family arabinose efflux permease